MNLKPQDIMIALKLVVLEPSTWSFSRLALSLEMSPSEVHAATKRLVAAKLAIDDGSKLLPNRSNLAIFLEHGLQFVFVPDIGGMTRGMPTGFAAPPLSKKFSAHQELPVWPDSAGTKRGYSFEPLYRSVPRAAGNDRQLYELLALVDAIRGGRARERAAALRELMPRLAMVDR